MEVGHLTTGVTLSLDHFNSISKHKQTLMTVKTKQLIVGFLGFAFLASLIYVQAMEVARKNVESGHSTTHVAIPASSKRCVECHTKSSPGIIDHWLGSTHANKGVGCVECHQAAHEDIDAFNHYGETIATVVSPRDCGRCHKTETVIMLPPGTFWHRWTTFSPKPSKGRASPLIRIQRLPEWKWTWSTAWPV